MLRKSIFLAGIIVAIAIVFLIYAEFGSTSVANKKGPSDVRIQLSPASVFDGAVDWANAGIDSFAPLSEGPQQAQLIDAFVDRINSIVDGSKPHAATLGKSLPPV